MGPYEDWKYGAERDETKKPMGRPATTERVVYDYLAEAAQDGAESTTNELIDHVIANTPRRRGGRNAVRTQVHQLMNKLEAEGKVASRKPGRSERAAFGAGPHGGIRVWRLPDAEQHTPETHGSASEEWLRQQRANAPENYGRREEQVRQTKKTSGGDSQPAEKRETWVDREARKHKERLESERAKSEGNKGQRNRQGGPKPGRKPTFVEKERAKHEQKLKGERDRAPENRGRQGGQGKPPKGGMWSTPPDKW